MSAYIAPPESFTSSPPTPPVGCDRGEERAIYLGYSCRDAHQYENLQRQLKEDNLWDHYEHKLRHDYFPLAKLYVLRVPGLLHGSFVFHITQRVPTPATHN